MSKFSQYWVLMFFFIGIGGSNKVFAQPDFVVQSGHIGTVKSVAYNNDGSLLATGGIDSNIKIWETFSGQLVKTISGHLGTVTTLAFHPSKDELVSASEDRTIKVWEVSTGKCKATLKKHTAWVTSVSYSPNEKYFASGGRDGLILVWDADKLILDKTIQTNGGWITAIDFSNDGKKLTSVGLNKMTQLWNVEDGKLINSFPQSEGEINAIIFHPTKNILVTAGEGQPVKFWDLNSFELIKSWNLTNHQKYPDTIVIGGNKLYNGSKEVQSLSFNDSGSLLALGCADYTTKIISFDTGELKHQLVEHINGIFAVAFSPDGSTIATGSSDGTAKIWDSKKGKIKFDLSTIGTSPNLTNIGSNAVDFSPNGDYLAIGNNDFSVSLWNLKTGRIEKIFTKHTFPVNAVKFNSDGTILASVGADNRLFLWDVGTSNTMFQSDKFMGNLTSVDFNSDGKYCVFGSTDRKIRVLDIKAKIIISEFEKPYLESEMPSSSDFVNAVAFYPFEDIIVSGNSDKKIRFWNLEGKLMKTLEGHFARVRALQISSDGKWMVSCSEDKQIKIWDLKSYTCAKTLKGHLWQVYSIDISPDGSKIVSGSRDKSIKIWDLKTGELIKTLNGHTGEVKSVRFDPSGRYVASASQDNYNKLWDVQSGRSIVEFLNFEKGKSWVSLSADMYYMSAGRSPDFIKFNILNEVFEFEQFDLKYSRPDKVLSGLPAAEKEMLSAFKEAYQKRLEKLGFTEEMLANEYHVPEIQVEYENLSSLTNNSRLTFSLKAKDQKQKLDRINVWVNDVPIFGRMGFNLREKNVYTWEQELTVELSNGKNKIQVSVLNQGGAESLKETFYITKEASLKKPNLYLIAIGVEKFQNARLNLDYPIKDLRDFIDLMSNHSRQYEKVVVDSLFNEQVTPLNLQRIKQKLQNSHVDDRVILFVSGHGVFDTDLNYYFATSGMDFNAPAGKGIPYETMENLLDGIPARQKLFLVDACHSGEIDKENITLIKTNLDEQENIKFRTDGNLPQSKKVGLKNSFELMKYLFIDLRRGTGATVISSAGGVEFAWEGEQWNNSVFSYCLLSGLKELKADANGDNKVMISELQDYLSQEVSRLTKNHQSPTMRAENISNDWQVW